jgi:hypothetical protein
MPRSGKLALFLCLLASSVNAQYISPSSPAGAGSGTVTSVGQSFTGGLISVSGSPVTTSGTLALTVAGTSGGIPYFASSSTWASSGVLTANAIVLGGGAGTAPAVLGSLGTTTTVLHGNAAGAPTFGAVALTTDVSGVLPTANGGAMTAPGYIASRWYTDNIPSLTTGGVLSTTVTYCYPSYIRQTFTTAQVGLNIQTGGSSNLQVALYNDSGGRPGTLLVASSSAADTGTGATTVTVSSTQLVGPAVIWKCLQVNDVTVKFQAMTVTTFANNSQIGSATLGGAVGTTNQVQYITTPGTFGTWPSLVGNTWTDGTAVLMPGIAIFTTSVP